MDFEVLAEGEFSLEFLFGDFDLVLSVLCEELEVFGAGEDSSGSEDEVVLGLVFDEDCVEWEVGFVLFDLNYDGFFEGVHVDSFDFVDAF